MGGKVLKPLAQVFGGPLGGILADKVGGRLSGQKEMEAQRAEMERQKQEEAAAKAQAEQEAKDKEEAARMDKSRSRTLLTGGSGLEDDENLQISRKTLLGS